MSTQTTTGIKSTSQNGTKKQARFDPIFTEAVVNATGPNANPRLRKVFAVMTRHVHDFFRESEVTMDEYLLALDMIVAAAKMTSDTRNELLLLSDVMGVESLIDEVNHALGGDDSTVPTALGPFWRANAPIRKMGDSIVVGIDGDHTYMHGTVLDAATGKPIENAELDIWETAPNGLYEQQDPDQVDMNLRGRFFTGLDGSYRLYCLRPTTYPIPDDGPTGDLLKLLDRHPMRPAHIHAIVKAAGYKTIVTELFDRRDKHVYDDAVFAVKEDLIVDFSSRIGDPKAQFELEYNFKLGRPLPPDINDAR